MTVYTIGFGGIGSYDVGSGSTLIVENSGTSSRSTISAGGLEYTSTGSTSEFDTVLTGGELIMNASGTLIDAQIAGYVREWGNGVGAIVSAGGYLQNGLGTADDASVLSGGYLEADPGAEVTSSIISPGGELVISSGGDTADDVVLSGGVLGFYNAADISGVRMHAGAVVQFGGAVVASGQTSRSFVLTSAIDYHGVTLSSGDTLGFYYPVVSNGGTLLMGAGSHAEGVFVESGTLEGSGEINGGSDSGGLVSGVRFAGVYDFFVLDGRAVDVRVGGDQGSASYLFIDNSIASAVQVDSGGRLYASLDGAEISGTRISSGGYALVSGSGGAGSAIAEATVISSGGVMVASGGIVSAAIVHGGGELSGSGLVSGTLEGVITDGGGVSAFTVAAGAELDVHAGAVAGVVNAVSGGTISVAVGGTGRNLTTVSGGVLVVEGRSDYLVSNTLGGALSGHGVVAQSGTGLLIQSGDASAFDGTAVIDGGTIELANHFGFGSAVIEFAAIDPRSATLELLETSQPANGATFSEALLNFDKASDAVDLRRQAFVSGATATLSGGVLTLIDGDYTAGFLLSGSTSSSFASGYTVTSDGHGGTLIVAAASDALARPAVMAQSIAAFAGGPGIAPGATPHSTGHATALAALLTPR